MLDRTILTLLLTFPFQLSSKYNVLQVPYICATHMK